MTTSSSTNSQATSSTAGPQQNKKRQPLQFLWPFLWMALLGGSTVFCLWAVMWLTRIPPVPDCEQVTVASVWRDRLYCAKTLIKAGGSEELTQAIQLTMDWPRIHSNYDEAQALLETASEKLLVLANGEAQQGNLDAAVAMASNIPLGTPLRQSAQTAIFNWRQEWEAGEALEAKIETAIANRQWPLVRQHLQTLQTLNLDYWLRDRHGHWQERLELEQRAWNQVAEARAAATAGTPEELQRALEIGRQVPLGSHAWEQIKTDLDRWSNLLVGYALERWQQGNLAGAMEIAQVLPPNPNYPSEMQDLIQFSHAQKLAQQASPQAPNYLPSYGDLFALMEAIRAGEQISPESPFHGEAQTFIQDWRAQLEDLRLLQSAHMLASLGQASAYRLAIAQAAEIGPDRPRRLQGQTLIAHWQNQIERIQDRPILVAADRLSSPGTIPALRAAITKASEVELGRALRIEAQTRIADWRREIQVIEDRPIINEANALASADQLREAIEVAQRVQPGRALYPRAQSLIEGWTAQIQIAEDRPILNEAKDLAYTGRLTRAINLAAQIAPGRALYDEAQNAIAIWKAEREYIWSLREAEAAAESAESTDSDSPAEATDEPAEDSSDSP